MAEFSPTRTHATWKPRVSKAHLPYYRCSECGAIIQGIDGNVEITYTNDGERSLVFEPPYGHVDFTPSCCGKPMEKLELIPASEVEDRFKLTYEILGGMNNNCIEVNWRSVDSRWPTKTRSLTATKTLACSARSAASASSRFTPMLRIWAW